MELAQIKKFTSAQTIDGKSFVNSATNIKNDIKEAIYLADSNPNKVTELAAILSDQLREFDAQMLTDKARGKCVEYPDEIQQPI